MKYLINKLRRNVAWVPGKNYATQLEEIMDEGADAIEKLEAENAQLKAELAAMRDQKPVAWGWKKSNGVIYDTICADEHDRHEGEYLTPLYEAAGAMP